MEKEKDTRKLMRVYIKPETEPDIIEWAENQQNVGIAIKALIRMAIAVQGTRDILAMPFGMNALMPENKQGRGVPNAENAPLDGYSVRGGTADTLQITDGRPKPDDGGLEDIRSAYYGNSDDMDIFGEI